MLIKDILLQLESATHPVAKIVHKNDHVKILVLGFKKGMILKEHMTLLPAKLFVIKGEIIYKQGEAATTLSIYDEMEIPVNVQHSVEAIADSLCLLTQG